MEKEKSKFLVEFSNEIAEYATKALLYEVSVTPKPGLVDRKNQGSHKDMDYYTFLDSAVALTPYFKSMTELGQITSTERPETTFYRLQDLGKEAEAVMYQATGYVNTHKGAIFSLGILCGALGRLKGTGEKLLTENLVKECVRMTKAPIEYFFETMKPEMNTAGCRLYRKYGIQGIRGEVASGFLSVRKEGLPVLKELLERGYSYDRAGSITLLYLIAETIDTNIITRSDYEMCMKIKNQLKRLIKEKDVITTAMLEKIDQKFIEYNISPGGSADLLAVSWFLYFLENRNKK